MGYTSLNRAVDFGPGQTLPDQGTVLLTDTVGSDGSFLLHHFLANALQPPSFTAATDSSVSAAESALRTQLRVGPTPEASQQQPSSDLPSTNSYGVVLVGLAQIFNHYLLIARKLGLNLNTYRDKRRFYFVDGVSRISPMASFRKLLPTPIADQTTPTPTAPNAILPPILALQPDTDIPSASHTYLDKAFNVITQGFAGMDATRPCLVIDNLTVLWDLGLSTEAVLGFVRSCKLWAESKRGVLVMLTHADRPLLSNFQAASFPAHQPSTQFEYFLKALVYLTNFVFKIEPLSSGNSRDVHGQLSIIRGPQCQLPNFKSVVRHYKVYDNNVEFFAPGLSQAVL
ncbi:Elongator subunit elp6 [Dimargaris xerosporica]|nr:Elongator subunit elp6 [Dimargaris xerosporica]